ncbi:ABC transporter substrate-binding protein [Cohnella sp. CFH 77786]|uniref:nickel ABC transporter substrate-binding protein n=1 Tax=Cohnella sp. CFH 77786 TaxID=2662265 RepID=UPI001C60F8F0|nr:nickel ABC transporter substrate-binding protein [Cohnella sp. CFH 77786]MBW5446377.1 ABC transporter substrate-binding protein [Cohnella sp. CFH 77786]
MFYRRIQSPIFALLIAGVFAMAAGCSAGTKQGAESETKKVTLILPFKSASLDPNNDYTPLRSGVTETLVKLDDQLNLQGWLATKWEAKDEKTWSFTIRDGVHFHDGAKLDAAAVKSSFQRGLAVSKTLAGALKISSMEADGQTLTIRTTEPHPSLPSELVSPYASVVNAEAEKKMGKEEFNRAPVGTGPFQVTSFTPNAEVRLVRFDGYWGGIPKLNEAAVKFNEDGNVRAIALQSKEADIVYGIPAESIEAIKRDEALKIQSISGLRVHYILYNQQKPLLQDIKVRTALNRLLNRESIARDILLGNGSPANGPFNDKLPFGSQEPVPIPDAPKAKALLKEAGYVEGADGKMMKDGKPLELELITYKARPELPLIAQLMQSDAAKAGVTITIKLVDNADVYLQENKDWDLATYSNLTAPRGDGGYFLNSAFVPEGSLNHGHIHIASLNEIVKQLNKTNDSSQRVQLTKEAAAVINREIPHSYAVFPNLVVGVNSRITGWVPGREEFYILNHTMDVQ